MNNTFSLDILKQGWLQENLAESDLCSHGEIFLQIGEQIITNGEECYGISESALALLRTTLSDHSPENSVAEKLIFHGCGTILMIGCNIGIDWTVRHVGENVELSNVTKFIGNSDNEIVTYPQLNLTVPLIQYKAEIERFALKAKSLFDGVPKKVSENKLYPNKYQLFWKEYADLLGAIGANF